MQFQIIFLLIVVVFLAGCITQQSQITGEVVEPKSQESIQPTKQPVEKPTSLQTTQNFTCEGTLDCYYGNVTRIIDGDTIEVDGVRIRLVLVDAPESSQAGGFEATNFVHQFCSIGSQVIIDQDDRQLYDNYGRMLAVVWCQGKRLNEEIIAQRYANIYYEFCSQSEFGDGEWAVKLGCIEKTSDCHPSYPTLCIPYPPPDLDCSDISDRNFQVLSPDPHRFDGDKNGIGCES